MLANECECTWWPGAQATSEIEIKGPQGQETRSVGQSVEEE